MSFEKPWGNYLLDGIVETTAPEAISFWPQTIAWQCIFILLILLASKKAYQLWKTYQDNAYRREALIWLKQCSLTNEKDVRQLPTLLRKTALLANEVSKKNANFLNQESSFFTTRHQDITLLTGDDWASWLDKHCKGTNFSQVTDEASSGKLLAEIAYIPKLALNEPKFNEELKQLCQQMTIWINSHNLSDDFTQQIQGGQT